ncbi:MULTISPECIES: Nif3-like dinuclear metal center hexameric protein [unclassified Spirosoma]|uniref:Nif3-like dinuclear metal center hexameric protein n=1 Tax=unclassified Spirosoma TaxID=2621999 RepID=UPI000961621A|nr:MULTISPECIES: Nif3-like dinuclear metal center hexameric protein [unclassified Spirosoma]MBN8825329.1 Nif3-like dinuclear metal center hexameric protein [Spirosoma sp.]OJW77502.1 MAG: Nif3-like dinuclear metal center hexameric protein [Spirosoma sp. 48-14]
MTQIRQLTAYLESFAPLAYQESYDNAGLIVGDPGTDITGVLVTLDVTEAVVDEAIAKGCNLIVAHHPIVFKGLKKLNGKTYVERTVIKAIKYDVAIYAAHTNLDNVVGGVNFKIAEKLQLTNVHILAPKTQVLSKLVTFVPPTDTQRVLDALYAAGAGQIGEYKNCSFRTEGTGTYQPGERATPTIGEIGKYHEETEHRIEVIIPTHQQGQVLNALRQVHPYEEVAYYLTTLDNQHQEVGSGAVGELAEPLSGEAWLSYLKKNMQLNLIRYTPLPSWPIRRIAVCGGVGSFLLPDAIRAGADIFVTADYKYHEFFDADNRIGICDIGHYESEVFTKELISGHLAKKFTTFAVILSETDTNPVRYF